MASARLLVVAGEAAPDLGDLPFGAQLLIDAAEEILVVAPALPTRLAWLASDTDKTREIADERLRGVLSQIDSAGKKAGGVVGADDPLLAFDDAVAEFRPDHILIGLRGPERSDWQERGLVDQVLERFLLPVTVFRLGDAPTD